MKKYSGCITWLLGVLLCLTANATNISQLTFDRFSPSEGTCELNELGYISVKGSLKFKGKIEKEKRGYLCRVTIPMDKFDKMFHYCSIAFVEIAPPVDLVCGVTHFKGQAGSVEFAWGFKYSETESPMCSFVCPRK